MPSNLQTVDQVDLQRYVGKWYEIARMPNRFEKMCDRDVVAEYAMRGGVISVRNTCVRRNGNSTMAKGTAKVVDERTGAKLKVTFFWPFYGDYWIIGLDPGYRWALVGEPKRRYLWVLSRTPSLAKDASAMIEKKMVECGYDPAMVGRTRQTSAEDGEIRGGV
jgi:apolipoprotein D and lipocalin family protein